MDLNLPKNILVVDADSTIGKSIEQTVAKMGVDVTAATDVTSALESYASNSYEAVIVDAIFPPIGGLSMIQKWRKSALVEKRNCGFILMTGNQIKQESENLLKELGEINVMSKPLSLGSLVSNIANARENHRIRLMRMDVVQQLRKMANSGAPASDLERTALNNIKLLGSDAVEVIIDIFLTQLGLVQASSRLIDKIGLSMSVPPIQLINARGRILLHSGQNELALKAFEEADSLAPNKIDRIHQMIDLYLELQIPDKGVEKMKEIIKLTPESPNIKFNFLSDLVDAGFDLNAKELASVISSATEVVRHYNNQGVAMARHGHKQKAMESYETAIRVFPTFKDSFKIHYNKALASSADKTPSSIVAAIKSLDKSIELNPSYEKAIELRKRLMASSGHGGTANLNPMPNRTPNPAPSKLKTSSIGKARTSQRSPDEGRHNLDAGLSSANDNWQRTGEFRSDGVLNRDDLNQSSVDSSWSKLKAEGSRSTVPGTLTLSSSDGSNIGGGVASGEYQAGPDGGFDWEIGDNHTLDSASDFASLAASILGSSDDDKSGVDAFMSGVGPRGTQGQPKSPIAKETSINYATEKKRTTGSIKDKSGGKVNMSSDETSASWGRALEKTPSPASDNGDDLLINPGELDDEVVFQEETIFERKKVGTVGSIEQLPKKSSVKASGKTQNWMLGNQGGSKNRR